jgi:hypothetical protein
LGVADFTVFRDPCPAFALNNIAAPTRDCPRYATAVLQLAICRVDDGIDFFDGDITLHNLEYFMIRERVLEQNFVHTPIVSYFEASTL